VLAEADVNPAAFTSILFERPTDEVQREDPSMVRDLNLDQVFAAVASGRGEYDLTPFFAAPLRDVRAVEYRHEVQRDLADDALAKAVADFALAMHEMREDLGLSGKLRDRYQKERWFLDAVAQPGVVRDLYDVAVAAITGERHLFGWTMRDSPDSILYRARQVMQLYLDMFRRLRGIADTQEGSPVCFPVPDSPVPDRPAPAGAGHARLSARGLYDAAPRTRHRRHGCEEASWKSRSSSRSHAGYRRDPTSRAMYGVVGHAMRLAYRWR
jgi:hypothetical protein